MSITIWGTPFEVFANVASAGGDHWLRSQLSQAGNPLISDGETPASTFQSGGPNDYAIYVTAQNFAGDVQAPLKVADTGAVSLPFAPFSAFYGESSSSSQWLDFAIWWRPSAAVAGAYDIELQNFSDNLFDIGASAPALALVGTPTTLASGVVDPVGYAYADNGQDLVFAYATQTSASTKNVTLQIFTPTGQAVSSPVQALTGAPLSTVYRVAYFAATSSFEFVQSTTVGAVQGFDFSAIDTTTGALGTPTFQAVPLGGGVTGSDPIAIDNIAFGKLSNGDILEFVGYRDTAGAPYWQGVETRLLNSSFQDISASTSGFVSGGFETSGQQTPAHWEVSTLANGDTILIYSMNSVVTIEEFGANGDVIGNYEFTPNDPSGDASPPTDFNSIVAMGNRFEVTYQRADGAGSQVYAAIYDTSTAPASYTIDNNGDPYGEWVGTPFDDTITYGAGINEINGGGGIDTFVASQPNNYQPAISINAAGNAVVYVDANDVDTLVGFSRIVFSGTAVAISGRTLTTTFLSGAKEVTTYSNTGKLFSTKDYNASGQLTGVSYMTQVPNDFRADGHSDILFKAQNGALATWLLDGVSIVGGGAMGNPGPAWTYEGAATFYGNNHSDILFRNQNGMLADWEIAGSLIVGGGNIGNPGGSWSVVGLGDFYGDGYGGVLFQDASGELAVWDVHGSKIVAGGNIGNPGGSYRVVGIGDFNQDGKSDILFENASGQFATWLMNGASVVGGATLGTPGAGWVYKGIGDLKGFADSSILFENVNTGDYVAWDVVDDKIAGVQNIGAPGAAWSLEAIGDYGANGGGGLLFRDINTGNLQVWSVDDDMFKLGESGNPGPDYLVAQGGPPAQQAPVAATIAFLNADGRLAEWDVAGGSIFRAGDLGVAPGYTALAVGDFNGDGQADILFEKNGVFAVWETNGASISGGGTIGSPGGTYQYKGVGDFNGDGTSDILFEDASGNYATWDLHGTSIVGGGALGNPGAGLSYVGAGDFLGDGQSDLLLKDGAGNYWISFVSGNKILGTEEVGNPGAGYALAAIGDLNGDGKADLLFSKNGALASWDLNGASIVGGGTIGAPGADWSVSGISDFGPAGHAAILFDNAVTGQVADWLVNNTSVIGGGVIGSAASSWSVLGVK